MANIFERARGPHSRLLLPDRVRWNERAVLRYRERSDRMPHSKLLL
jgi:hypothetical protein